jgi:hypothetical protein
MTSMLDSTTPIGIEKWEYFWLLKNAWSHPLILARAGAPLAMSQWTLYRTVDHRFPLCDSPVMIDRDTLMVVLSPRLLLEINLTTPCPEDHWTVQNGISTRKYREFRRRAIANSFKDILFHEPAVLLYVRVKPSGQSTRTQKFSLLGFTAATRVLAGRKCQDDGGAQASSNLEVKLTRNSDGGVVVSNNTSLPDGMSLMISLRAGGGYYAQDKVQVRSGSYESAAFSDKGRALSSGNYRVSISSPLMDLQPARVKRKLSSSGSGIPEDIREKSSYGDSYTVKYSVSRTLE